MECRGNCTSALPGAEKADGQFLYPHDFFKRECRRNRNCGKVEPPEPRPGPARRPGNPTLSATSSRTAYRSRRLFCIKSSLTHSVAPPFQTKPALLGFGLGMHTHPCRESFDSRHFSYTNVLNAPLNPALIASAEEILAW